MTKVDWSFILFGWMCFFIFPYLIVGLKVYVVPVWFAIMIIILSFIMMCYIDYTNRKRELYAFMGV